MKRIEFEDALVVEPAKVSVLDELPVGSVIDFDGTDIPAGWEEVEATDNYSTEETFTGKYWIDGKKIYRKVFEFEITVANQSLGNISNLNIDTVVTFKDISQGDPISSGYYKNNVDNFYIALNKSHTLFVTGGSSYPALPYKTILILEYTKTTD